MLWKLDATIPAAGLDSMYIIDTVPEANDVSDNNRRYRDSFVLNTDGEVYIDVEGLVGTESYKTTKTLVNDDKTEVYQIKIEFYKDKEQTKTGLTSTNNARHIIIRLKTKHNQKWVDAASRQLSNMYLAGHKNNASLYATSVHDESVKIGVSSSVYVLNKEIKKSLDSQPTDTNPNSIIIDGIAYPAYTYTVKLYGMTTEDDMPAIITETFDSSIWKIYEGGNDEYTKYDLTVYAGENYKKLDTAVTSITPTATGATISVTGNTNTYYKLTYTLIPKDKEALERICQQSLDYELGNSSENVKVSNTASWAGKVSTTVSADFNYDYLSKTIISEPTAENNYTVDFKVVVNPTGITMNNGNLLVVKDTMSSTLRFMPETLKVTADGQVLDDVKFNVINNILTTTVPDGKSIEMTYSARIIGANMQNITYSNSVEVEGLPLIDFIENKNVEINMGSGGSGSIYHIKLRKHELGNLNKHLAGATFRLEQYDSSTDTWKSPHINGAEITGTSDDNGLIEFSGNQGIDGWSFYSNTKYRFVETKAPDNYILSSEPVEFVITPTPTNSSEYFNGETIYIANTPKEITYGNLELQKSFKGIDAGDVDPDSISFTISPEIDGKSTFSLRDFTKENDIYSLRLTDVPCQDYTITETCTAIDGYDYTGATYTISVGANTSQVETGNQNGNTVISSVMVSNNTDTIVQLTNHYKKKDSDSTSESTTSEPTTSVSTTSEPTTSVSTTSETTTSESTTTETSTDVPTTDGQTTGSPTTTATQTTTQTDTNSDNTANTGDNSQVTMALILMLFSLGCIFAIYMGYKKDKVDR